MQIYLLAVVCASNLLFRAGNLCSASTIYLSASSSSDGWLSEWDSKSWDSSSYIWIITAPYGQKVLLNFDQLRISYSYNCGSYLEVRDGSSPYSPLLTKQCYLSTPPSPVYSTGRSLYVNFHKPYYYNSNGISAKFRALPSNSAPDCPKVLEGNNTGVIYSPGFPNSYPANSECTWTIGKSYYTYLLLNFTVFDLENGCYGKVVVKDGQYSRSPELGQFCQDSWKVPFVVTPSGGFARVEFTSDYSSSEKGFLMFYKFLDSPYTHITTPSWWKTTPYIWYTDRWWTTPTPDLGWRTAPTPHLDYTRRSLAIVLPIVIGIVLLVIIIVIVLCENHKRARNPAPVITAPPLSEIPLQTLQRVSVPPTAFLAQQRALSIPTSTVGPPPAVSTGTVGAPTAPLPSTLLSADEPQVEFSGQSPGAETLQPPHNDADWVANFSDQPSSQSRDTSEQPLQVRGENYYAPSPVQNRET